uniref:Uncharacterized protein n=1 Tax=Meleagris gallopavo TaxID=9103 RepID=G3UU08_MELGA
MAAEMAALQQLHWRLEELEQRVGVGACEPSKVADELVRVQLALSNIAGKRERIKILCSCSIPSQQPVSPQSS